VLATTLKSPPTPMPQSSWVGRQAWVVHAMRHPEGPRRRHGVVMRRGLKEVRWISAIGAIQRADDNLRGRTGHSRGSDR
jgi:hypothetical protein